MLILLELFALKTIAVVMEAFPFVIFGALVSGGLEVFVSSETIMRLLPKRRIPAILGGVLMGVLLPSCECGIIPIVRRLINKKVPLHVAVSYLVSAPVINPIVVIATYVGFRNSLPMTLMRVSVTVVTAVVIGLIVSFFKSEEISVINNADTSCSGSCCSHEHSHKTLQSGARILQALLHAKNDFARTMFFLIIGASFASLFHLLTPRSLLEFFRTPVMAIFAMMIFAILLSVCSEADSFVAASFTSFSPASQIAFVTIGPIVDLKLLMMYPGLFKRKGLFLIIGSALLLVFASCLFLHYAIFGGIA